MGCDMCGAEATLYRVLIEDTELNVCKDCKQYGKVISRPSARPAVKKRLPIAKREEPEKVTALADNYSAIVKAAREKRGLTQKHLARALAQKESLIHNLESGRFKPSIDLAKRFERFLKIKIVEELEQDKQKFEKHAAGERTIGDLLAMKRT